jgi:Arc/MetJ-type ribon-helix-helix transcriptional regulator
MVSIDFPVEDLKKIDELWRADMTYKSRADFIRKTLLEKINQEEVREAPQNWVDDEGMEHFIDKEGKEWVIWK